MGKKRFLFISPHLDDAVLSCGGFIGKLGKLDYPVTVLTVFSGSPDENLSLLAKALHAEWGLSKDAAAVRREEDKCALDVLGAKLIHAGFLDCIYRKDVESGKFVYTRLGQILGQQKVEEESTTSAISEYLLDMIRSGKWDHVFVPLALGGHIDHRITHKAITRNIPNIHGIQFHFYEDLPYAVNDFPGKKLHKLFRDYLCTSCEGDEQKYAAMLKYSSQIKSARYLGGIDIDAIVRYGLQVGEKASMLAERVWFSEK